MQSNLHLHLHGQTRSFSFAGIPKVLAKASRIPAAFGGALVGGAAYVNYKVQEVGNYTSDRLHEAQDWVASTYDKARGALEAIELPDFSLGDFFGAAAGAGAAGASAAGSGDGGDGASGGDKNSSGGSGGGNNEGVGLLAAGAALSLEDSDEDLASDEQMMVLTKKMIEIRQILQRIDQSDTLQLPSIVVIGSQSSGKSSVLEAIVGHEFLPKGSNMVTRRPIELTLVNTPDSPSEYAEFPALGFGKITDFSKVQKTLTDLNLAVPESDAVCDEPIQLFIYSPNVPDLNLIDLPGYIQVAASDQPGSLKSKINMLCEKYIQAPNVILAISAADVDLANSSALRASRRVDPRGERTIGVITKIDLVPSERAKEMLQNRNYPLKMGYVGVITKSPSLLGLGAAGAAGGLFRRSSMASSHNMAALVAQNEESYFSQHDVFEDCTVGTVNLKRKLMGVLEKTMANSLQPTAEAIHQELEETTYQFKVEYNDRELTSATYLARSIDQFKMQFKELTQRFGRDQVRRLLKSQLDQKVLDLLAQRYWNKPSDVDIPASRHVEPPLANLTKESIDDLYWHRKLDSCTSSLTKLGVGRVSTNLVIAALTSEMRDLVSKTTFANHPFARNLVNDATSDILNMRFYSTADQVENCIKPYKYEIEVGDREWSSSRDHSYNLLKEDLRQCEDSLSAIRKTVGSKKLNQVIKYVEQKRALAAATANTTNTLDHVVADTETEALSFSPALVTRAKEAMFLRDRADILKLRMTAIKSRTCKSKENKYACPEVFLDVVADKLTETAVLFLNVELLSDFYYQFPRELDQRLGGNLSEEQIEAFAKQDPKIKHHIELQQRKELLELALSKMESLMELHNGRSIARR